MVCISFWLVELSYALLACACRFKYIQYAFQCALSSSHAPDTRLTQGKSKCIRAEIERIHTLEDAAMARTQVSVLSHKHYAGKYPTRHNRHRIQPVHKGTK